MTRISLTLRHPRLSSEPIILECDVTNGVLRAGEVERIASLVTAQIERGLAAPTNHNSEAKSLPTKSKLIRTQNGCLTCRRRRVKCDEEKPVCGSCRRNPNRVCRYQVNVQRQASMQTGRQLGAKTAQDIHLAAVGSHSSEAEPSVSVPSLVTVNRADQLFLLYQLSTVTFAKLGGGKNTGFRMAQLEQAWSLSLNASNDMTPTQSMFLRSALCLSAEHVNYTSAGKNPLGALSQSLRMEIVSQLAVLVIPEGGGLDIDELHLILNILDLVSLRDIIAAEKDSQTLLQFSVLLIQLHGGPAAILDRQLDPSKQGTMRCTLMHHAAWELFSVLSTGASASMLADGSTLWCEQDERCYAMIEEEFGISLPILLAATQVSHLVAAVRSEGLEEGIQNEAMSLFAGLEDVWLATICASPNRPRIQAGNFLFRHTMICILLRDVLGYGVTHPRIRQSVAAIKELLIEAMVLNMAGGMMVGLLQPALVGGSMCAREERDTFSLVIREMHRTIGCRDVEMAEKALAESWTRTDAGRTDWSIVDVCSDPALPWAICFC